MVKFLQYVCCAPVVVDKVYLVPIYSELRFRVDCVCRNSSFFYYFLYKWYIHFFRSQLCTSSSLRSSLKKSFPSELFTNQERLGNLTLGSGTVKRWSLRIKSKYNNTIKEHSYIKLQSDYGNQYPVIFLYKDTGGNFYWSDITTISEMNVNLSENTLVIPASLSL